MDNLTSQFMGIEVAKAALYNFMRDKCRISLNKAHLHSVDRNAPENLDNRFNWVTRWMQTDMDYLSHCVFIDQAAFHINMKRTVAWSRGGSRAEAVLPKTRAKTTTILGAIPSVGIINVKVRRPRALAQKN